MSIADRPYYRDETDSGMMRPRFALWRVTTWLIVINVVVFVIDELLERMIGAQPLRQWGHFSFITAIRQLEIWRWVSFQFLHSGVWHLVFNMLCLHYVGGFLENYFGTRRYLGFYLLSGAGGAMAYLLLWMIGLLIESPYTPLLGASAGIYGLLIAMAILAPHGTVFMWPIPIPITMRTLALLLIGIALVTVFGNGQNAGGEAAHLGGAAVGFVLFKFPQSLALFQKLPAGGWFKRHRQSSWQKKLAEQQALEKEIDRILAKVHSQGLASLTAREKRTLEQPSREQRRI